MKGILKVLEVIIAVIAVLIVYLIVFSAPVVPPDFESINFELEAFNSLKLLDQNNELRVAAMQNDTTTIANKLSNLLPSNINIRVSVCGSSCSAPVINSTRIFTVGYIISGDVGNFNPKQVIVYMWS